MKKIVSVLVIIMLLLTGFVLIDNDFNVEGTGGDGENNSSIGLDYLDYIWEQTLNVSNVIYEYPPDLIPKGRSFGSWGANYTVNEILMKQMDDIIGLEDVHKEKIQHLTGKNKNYTSIINMTDFQLTINNDDYPYENPIPKKEIFCIPVGLPARKPNLLTQNFSFNNTKIYLNNMTQWWPLAGTFNSYSYNITEYDSLEFITPFVVGNVTYLEPNDPVPSINEQYGRVFLIEDAPGAQNKLDSLKTSEGSIIIDTGDRGLNYFDNPIKANVSVISINNTDGAFVKELLENYTTILVDNVTGNLTFTYNLNQGWWPYEGHIYLDRIPDHYELWSATNETDPFLMSATQVLHLDKPNIIAYLTLMKCKSIFWALISESRLIECKGILLYDSHDYHFMIQTGNFWDQDTPYFEWEPLLPPLFDNINNFFDIILSYVRKGPALPCFTMNYSVGNWLNQHRGSTTINAYADQELLAETTENPGLEAYNVIGNITIDNNPDDTIAILSNRYDGMWGQTPSDSGVGAAIVLGIAKYMKENDIKPKYNLTFLFTTGEEYGFRGAYYYNDSHPNDNIKYWFILDQLAFDQSDTTLCFYFKNNTYRNIINETIENQTQYTIRTGYYNKTINDDGYGSEQFVASSRQNCDSFCWIKDLNYSCDKWHRTGTNYTEGDCLNHTDRNDVNVTAELVWNITKYFLIDPDCWLTNVTFEAFDSTNDGDTLLDTIKTNFTINSILPNDLVMINASLINSSSEETVSNVIANYTVNSTGFNSSITTSIPDTDNAGNYSLSLKLYNSTGRINEIVNIGNINYNDTSSSNVFHLYHPFGYTKNGNLYKNIKNNITGSIFTANENAYADNITAYINKAFMSPGPYKCMLYRLNDSKLIGNTSENWVNRDNEDPPCSTGWAVFNFSEPKPSLVQDTQYVITCWGEDDYCRLYYDDFSSQRGCYNQTDYSSEPPDYPFFNNESRLYSIYCSYTAINFGPNITSITSNPDVTGFGMNVTISADVSDVDGVDTVKVNIVKPQNETGQASIYNMTKIDADTYRYVYNDTWVVGQYNYTIGAIDDKGYSNISSQYSFNISAQATITVCTVKDEYGNNTVVNVTDPPDSPPLIGYELLDDGKVLHIWNKFDSYYFNTTSGIQLTNHYNEYWSHNVLMLGYYNNDQWNLVYRTDELSGFNKNIDTDNETYVNATLWKNLTYQGYNFRLAIRYYLGVDDKKLTIIPYIKNLGQVIQYNLGFAWELKDIQVDMTPSGDYIEINGTTYYLNQSLDETYKNMDQPYFYIRENISSDRSESLYLCWDDSLDYLVKVKSREGQYNAPVTLGIKIGTLGVGQEKYTSLSWYDASEITYYFNSYSVGETWATNPGYMVDGSTSTYASTTVGGDVELINGNNCSGTDLGNIVKVELRVYGYYSGTQRDIILRPVFSGTIDGVNYYYSTGTSPAWSRWFDITDDPYAPQTWSWIDVDNLDCDVEAKSGYSYFTLYCSKVEIRVTYIPNNNPIISDPYPSDGSNGIPIAPVLNITVSDPDGDSMNITWFSNSSGSWQVFGTNNSVGNGTYHQTMANASINGQWWYWKVNVTDGAVSVESSVYKFYTGYESKIKNTGSTNISGYLLMQVQFFDGYNNWVVAVNGPDETSPRVINSGEQFGLDTVFNGKINTSFLIDDFGTGLYRVYAAFRDPDGNVLQCDDDSLLEATYEFTVNI